MKVFSFAEKEQYKSGLFSINEKAWPEFMLHWNCKDWAHLYTTFGHYQILLLNDDDELMAYGHTIPFHWDDDIRSIPDNLKTLIEMSVESNEEGLKPNILLALAAVVSKDHKGKGLSFEVVKAMKDIALKNNMENLIVPVRPTLKSKYPLIPISEYAEWKREDGMPFDPWLRVHKKLGGEVFKTADVSMIIRGEIEEWEHWTNNKILGSGRYIFEGALNPVEIDIHRNLGTYTDPCVWIHYSVK